MARRGIGSQPVSERIVIGFPATPQGEDALALGSLLARLLGAKPVVTRVIPWPRHLLGDDPDAAIERETRGAFDLARDRLAGLEIETRAIAEASVSRALFDVIDETEAELVVVGSTHRGTVGRLMPGNVTSALLHGAATAVAVAPRGYCEGPRPEIARIGVAVNDSDESRQAVAAAATLAGAAGAKLDLIGASDPNPFGYTAAFEVMTAGEVEGIATEHARRALESARDSVPAGIETELHLRHDEPGAALAEASESLDLLLLGSRGYGPIGRTFLGSVSGYVTRKAACPVIVTPRGLEPTGIWSPRGG
jgi:nucleotide-binding universal stress UspA family protein